MAVLEEICRTPTYRRELLWIRALEKDDLETALMLEESDPEIRVRLTKAGLDIRTGRDRHHFSNLWHVRNEQIAEEIRAADRKRRGRKKVRAKAGP